MSICCYLKNECTQKAQKRNQNRLLFKLVNCRNFDIFFICRHTKRLKEMFSSESESEKNEKNQDVDGSEKSENESKNDNEKEKTKDDEERNALDESSNDDESSEEEDDDLKVEIVESSDETKTKHKAKSSDDTKHSKSKHSHKRKSTHRTSSSNGGMHLKDDRKEIKKSKKNLDKYIAIEEMRFKELKKRLDKEKDRLRSINKQIREKEKKRKYNTYSDSDNSSSSSSSGSSDSTSSSSEDDRKGRHRHRHSKNDKRQRSDDDDDIPRTSRTNGRHPDIRINIHKSNLQPGKILLEGQVEDDGKIVITGKVDNDHIKQYFHKTFLYTPLDHKAPVSRRNPHKGSVLSKYVRDNINRRSRGKKNENNDGGATDAASDSAKLDKSFAVGNFDDVPKGLREFLIDGVMPKSIEELESGKRNKHKKTKEEDSPEEDASGSDGIDL